MLVTYSNRLEALYESVKAKMFGLEGGAFASRWIVVPTHPLKNWLQQRLAEDPQIGVAAGIDFLFLEEAMSRICCFEEREGHFPTYVDLCLKIECVLRDRPSRWEEVELFLAKGKKRLGELAAELADLFLQYGLYGGRAIDEWEGWQAELWNEVFASWTYRAAEVVKPVDIPSGDIHFFGFSHIAPLYLRLLRTLPVHMYVLSPCQAFWLDTKSDFERRHLIRFYEQQGIKECELDQLDDYLRDCNPLVANWGRLGRDFVSQLEDCESDEVYVMPGNSMLESVQRDMLELENPLNEFTDDGSIQVHQVPSKIREVEVLRDILVSLCNEGVKPSDIIVMAPDIGEYVPYVQALFRDFPYQIQDLHRPLEGSVTDGFEKLINLAIDRWEVSKVLSLIEHPLFRERVGWDHEEIQQILRWLRLAGVSWGQDTDHRDACLADDYGVGPMLDRSGTTTWKHGLKRLLEILVMEDSPIDLSQGTLLGRFIELVDGLLKDLSVLKGGVQMSLLEWVDALVRLGDTYFGHLPPFIKELEESAAHFTEEKFDFATIHRLIGHLVGSCQRTIHPQRLDGAIFCSLVPMRAIPAPVVCLIGMDEESFPRRHRRRSLDRLSRHPLADTPPSLSEVDRYLFLEAILSARRNLVLIHQGVSSDDARGMGPSPLVAELMSYCGGLQACEHPHLPFHHSYYQVVKALYSQRLFDAAESYYQQERKPSHRFFKEGVELPPGELDQVTVVNLRDLNTTATDPARFYLNRTCGIFMEDQWSSDLEDDEAFSLSPIHRSQIVWKALQGSTADAIEQARTEGHFPHGLFGDLAQDVVEERIRSLKKWVGNGEVRDLTLVDGWDGPADTLIPMVEIDYHGQTVRIIGKISHVCSKGLIASGRDDRTGMVRARPSALVFAYLVKHGIVDAEPNVLFASSTRAHPINTDHVEEDLVRYLDYHFACKSKLVPLNPHRIAGLKDPLTLSPYLVFASNGQTIDRDLVERAFTIVA